MSLKVVCDKCGKTESQKWFGYKDFIKDEKGEFAEIELHFCSLKCFQEFVAELKEEKVESQAKENTKENQHGK